MNTASESIEQMIMLELKKRLSQLVKEKNLSFSQAASIASLLAEDLRTSIRGRYP